jgi:2-dehydro-3-deoxygluconokinase
VAVVPEPELLDRALAPLHRDELERLLVHRAGELVVTRGEEGALGVTDGAVVEQPTFEADTRDPVGTGDAFVGGFLARYLEDAPLDDALEFGAATAAVKRTLDGDSALVSRAEIEAVIEGAEGISR